MIDPMNEDENGDSGTQCTPQDVNRMILRQDIITQNALLLQTLLKQNEMLMGMLVLKSKQPEEVYVPPDLTKTFNGKCKPYEAVDQLGTLCGVVKLHRQSEALKLEAVRVNIDGPARQWYVGRKFGSWIEFEQQFKLMFVRNVKIPMESINSSCAR